MTFTIKKAPTSIDVIGGTDHIFNGVGTEGRKASFVNGDGVTLADQERFSIRTVQPQPDAKIPSGFTSGKVILDYAKPKTLADGSIKDDHVHIELKRTVESTDSDILEIRRRAAQMILDSEMDVVFNDLSLLT